MRKKGVPLHLELLCARARTCDIYVKQACIVILLLFSALMVMMAAAGVKSAPMAEEPADPLVERLYELIDRLPPDDKTLLTYYLDGTPISDIAKAMHCPKRSLERRISELKETLKRMNETED